MLPRPEDFPPFPATWYLFGNSRELRRPVSKDLLGTRMTGFRTATGKAVVLESRCSHLGADLGCGRVVKDTIQCPFHGWHYDSEGRCTHIPTTREIPPHARQRVFPVIERHGLVFFFNHAEPLFPIPFFPGCDPDAFAVSRPLSWVGNTSWYMLVSNGFDEQHFQFIHDRKLLAPMEFDEPMPFARRSRYRATITGNSLFDRMLKRFLGTEVEVSITSFGGPFLLVTGDFGKAVSRILISAKPRSSEQLDMDLFVFAPCRSTWLVGPMATWLSLQIRRWFTWGFMEDDFTRLRGIRYNPSGMIDTDEAMAQFFRWAANLPRPAFAKPGTSRVESDSAIPEVPSRL